MLCPACGSPETSGSRDVPDHEYELSARVTYARCTDCASEYQTPMPDADTLASFYPEGYHSFAGGGSLQRIRHDLRIRRLARLLEAGGPLGAILDYGCGDGSFLARLAEKIPDRALYGFEVAPSPGRRELAGGRIRIIRGHYRDLLDELPECALITMNHVIEHLPDPIEVVGALSGRLAEGGVFEGQTPAAGSTEQRVFGAYWSGYHAPRHTVVFSRRGLARLLERCDLGGVSLRAAFNPAGLAISLASLAHGDRSGRVVRAGWVWLAGLAAATLLAPVDLLGAPAVMDFAARRRA